MVNSRSSSLALLMLGFLACPVTAATIYSNLVQPGDLYGPDPVGIGAIPVPGFFQYHATNFIVGGQDYRLIMLELPLAAVFGPPDINVFLMQDNGGLPGAVLEEFHLSGVAPSPGPVPPLLPVPSAVQPLLLSGHQYWVAAAGAETTFAVWSLTLFAGDPVAGGATRSIQNGLDFGWVRNPGTRVAALRVTGEPLTGIPEPSAIPLVVLGVIALVLRSRRFVC